LKWIAASITFGPAPRYVWCNNLLNLVVLWGFTEVLVGRDGIRSEKGGRFNAWGLEVGSPRATFARVLRDQRLRRTRRRCWDLRISPSRRSARADGCPRAAGGQLDGSFAPGRPAHRVGSRPARCHDDEGT